MIKRQDGEAESKRGQLQSWDKMKAVAAQRQSKTLLWAFWAAALSLPPEKAWRFPEWQGRWRYLPLWLTFLEMMQNAWRQTRKRRLIYRYFCLVRLLGGRTRGSALLSTGRWLLVFLKKSRERMETKGGRTESAAFLSGNLALLCLQGFVVAQLRRLCWERGHGSNSPAGAGQSYTQPRQNHPMHTAPQHYSKLKGEKTPFNRYIVILWMCLCLKYSVTFSMYKTFGGTMTILQLRGHRGPFCIFIGWNLLEISSELS